VIHSSGTALQCPAALEMLRAAIVAACLAHVLYLTIRLG